MLSQLSIQTVGNPNRASPDCQGNASGFTFSGSGIDTRRKTCASVITKETDSLQLRVACSLTRRASVAALSSSNGKNLEREATLAAEGAGFQLPTLTYADVRYSVSQQLFRRTRFQISLIIVSGFGEHWSRYCGSYLGLEVSRGGPLGTCEHRTHPVKTGFAPATWRSKFG